jgi:hypothetical protein
MSEQGTQNAYGFDYQPGRQMGGFVRDSHAPPPPPPVTIPMIPPRLKARLEHYKAEMPPWYPVFDRIFVYPLEDNDQPDKVGSLYIPARVKKESGTGVGFIVAAGAKALEQLHGHGIGLGDIVLTARLSPWERQFVSPKTGTPHILLILRASEIVGSLDLLAAYEKGDLWVQMNADGTVDVADRESTRKTDTLDHNPDAI